MKKIILLISIFFLFTGKIYAKEEVQFSKCVDGDTIKVFLDNKEYTVRMLAIDTPESVKPNTEVEYYGKEASEYTCNKVKKAKKIELEYDDKSEKMDKYDRVLAWVFIDNKLLESELIEKGYAKVAYLYDDYKYTSILQEKQELASAKKIGIWNENAKEEYDKNILDNNEISLDNYTTIDVFIIVVILLVLVFVGNKRIKSDAKKKLKEYLK